MHNFTSLFHLFPAFFITVILSSGIMQPAPAGSAEQGILPENTISISFDISAQKLFGTSRITVPSSTPLTLYCGALEVTASILEPEGSPSLTLIPTEDNRISVPASKQPQTVYVTWSLDVPPAGANDNLISDEGITLAGLWHPVPDRDMPYSLHARIPRHFSAVTESDTIASTPCRNEQNLKSISTSFSHPVRSIHFAAGPYVTRTRIVKNKITLSTYFFIEDDHLADTYLERAAEYLERYQQMIGPYPYSRYNIVENRLPTGYGMPTFTLLGQAVVRLPFIKDTSLGHEILHSWFGNSVRLSDDSGNWSEGLTTYLADQLYAEDQGMGSEYRKNQLLRYRSYVPEDNEMTIQDFVNASDSQPLAKKIRAVGYDKASMVFHMLRNKLGDEIFYEGLNHFYMKYRYRRAGWNQIEKSFSQVYGTDLTDFFAQWLTRRDNPRLAFSNFDVSQVKGRSVISFTIKQQTADPYDLIIPVVISTRSGDQPELLKISDSNEHVELAVNELPTALVIDPDYDVMRDLSMEEIPPIWSMFLGAESKTAVLGSEADADIFAPLISYLEEVGCETVTADEVSNSELADGSYLFLGASSHSQGLFALPQYPDSGFILDVRKNPLDPHQVMVLTTSSSLTETQLATTKLRHYGKYSFLHFQKGRAVEKKTAPAANGIRIELFPEPEGIRVTDVQSFDAIIDELETSRVVYVGEIHTDMGNHILQLQVIQALYQQDPNLAIGLEMFPNSSQEVLDRYIAGEIETEGEFLKQSNYFSVWGYDYRLYREIIGFARRNSIPLVALNIDKTIVSQVFQEGGFDTLEDDQIKLVPAERNLDVPGYRDRIIKAFSSHDGGKFSRDRLAGFMQAQSIWDEAMADSIVGYLSDNPDRRMVVIAGTGHIYKDTAIPLRVKRRLDVSQKVISSINYGTTGLEKGYRVDYLLYTRNIELEPAPKVGVVLSKEETGDDPVQTRLRITQVSPHGKAGEAGILAKDIVLSVDGHEVTDLNDFKIALLDKKAGDSVKIRVLRERMLFPDEELEFEVELSIPMNMGGMPLSHPK